MDISITQLSKEDKYAQMSMQDGIYRYGMKAVERVLKEYTQLKGRSTFLGKICTHTK